MIRDQRKSLYVSFGDVEGVGIHIPTRGKAYKIKSKLPPGSSFVLEEELMFGLETKVWEVLTGESTYTRAMVVSGTITEEESSIRYTVCSVATMKAFHNIDDSFIILRGNQVAPPAGTVPKNLAFEEKVNIDDQSSPCANIGVSRVSTANQLRGNRTAPPPGTATTDPPIDEEVNSIDQSSPCTSSGVSEVSTANELIPKKLLGQLSPSTDEEHGCLNASPSQHTPPSISAAMNDDEKNSPKQAPSALHTQLSGCNDKGEDSASLVETRNDAVIASPRRSASLHIPLAPVSPLRHKLALNGGSREDLPHAKRIRSNVLSSPDPGEVFGAASPCKCQHSGYQDAITKVSEKKDQTEVASPSQRDNDLSSTRPAAATTDRHYEEEMETRSIRIPDWAPYMGSLRDRIIEECPMSRSQLCCWATMNMAFMRGTGGTAIVDIKAPKHTVDACTCAIQVLVASSAQIQEKTLMMHDLALSNAQWCSLDGDLAFVCAPPTYKNKRWVPLWTNPRPFASLDYLNGDVCSRSGLRKLFGRRIFILVMRRCAKPHIIVTGWAAKEVHHCVAMIRERLAWAEDKLHRR